MSTVGSVAGGRVGVGAWIRYGGPLADGEVEYAARHYRSAVLQPWETGAAARLKELRPDMTVLAYRCLSSVRDFEPPERQASGIGYERARRRGWLARRGGRQVEWSPYGGHLQARVWDAGYRAAWARAVVESLEGTAFDGVMADNDVFDDYYGLDLASLGEEDPHAPRDAAALRAALDLLVEEAGRALVGAGRVLVPNIAESRRQPGRWARHAAWGGGFDECWLGWGSDGLLDESAVLAQVGQLDGPGIGILRSPSGGPGPAWDGSRLGMYGLAAFWVLGGGAQHLSWTATGHDDYSRTPWFPAMDADLGRALGPARHYGNVWRRRFEGGVAAVVLSADRGATVTLPRRSVRPGPTGAPDGERLPRRLRLGPRAGVLALLP